MNKHPIATLFLVCFLILCAISWVFGSLLHEHDWLDATCTEPRTCKDCGETDGEPLGHNWRDATCTDPMTCRRCAITQGYRADHTWIPATCTKPEKCGVCGKKRHWYSLPICHDWIDATCTTPKTCSQCGATEGEPQHFFIGYSWDTTIEPTCQHKGEASHACKLCGAVETKILPVTDHKAGEWEIIVEATPSADGTKNRRCIWCGLEMNSTQYQYLDLRGDGGGTSTSENGNNFNAHDNPGQQNTTASYVLNTSTSVFHRPSCRDVPRIASQNYATSSRSRSELIASGYHACGHCSP